MSAAQHPRRLLTVEEYHRMADAGIIGPEERVELIEGEIYAMSPINGPHIVATGLVQTALLAVFGAGWIVLVQMPLSLSGSEPQPDAAVVRGKWRDLTGGPPDRAELVVEVSDSTLRFDQSIKAALYARSLVPEFWIVNLVNRVLELHRDPDPATSTYRTITRHTEGETVSPLAMLSASIAVADLLP